MDFNEYFAQWHIQERLREAEAGRRALTSAYHDRPGRRPFRVAAGLAMIRAGRWLLGRPAPCTGEPAALRR